MKYNECDQQEEGELLNEDNDLSMVDQRDKNDLEDHL